MKILSITNVPLEQCQSWAIKNKADSDFIYITIPLLYSHSVDKGINPLFTIAQSTKETGWGHFKGQVKKEFNNVCGLKKVDGERFKGSDSFHIFNSIEEGTLAHVEHICLYMGVKIENPIDPRHFSELKGIAKSPLDLCREWTGEDTYVEYYGRIMGMIDEIEDTEIVEIYPLKDKEIENNLINELQEENDRLKEGLLKALEIIQVTLG